MRRREGGREGCGWWVGVMVACVWGVGWVGGKLAGVVLLLPGSYILVSGEPTSQPANQPTTNPLLSTCRPSPPHICALTLNPHPLQTPHPHVSLGIAGAPRGGSLDPSSTCVPRNSWRGFTRPLIHMCP